MNRKEQLQEINRIMNGPVGEVAILERCPAPPRMNRPFIEGVVLVKAADGTLAKVNPPPEPVGVLPGVFPVGNVLVCVVLVVLGKQYFPVFVNLRDEKAAAGLQAMARQGFAMLGVWDGKTGLAMMEHRAPINLFAQLFDLLKEAENWTEAQFHEAREALERSFEDDLEGLLAALSSDANIALVECLMSLPAGPTMH